MKKLTILFAVLAVALAPTRGEAADEGAETELRPREFMIDISGFAFDYSSASVGSADTSAAKLRTSVLDLGLHHYSDNIGLHLSLDGGSDGSAGTLSIAYRATPTLELGISSDVSYESSTVTTTSKTTTSTTALAFGPYVRINLPFAQRFNYEFDVSPQLGYISVENSTGTTKTEVSGIGFSARTHHALSVGLSKHLQYLFAVDFGVAVGDASNQSGGSADLTTFAVAVTPIGIRLAFP
jgi:hypothetical protein